MAEASFTAPEAARSQRASHRPLLWEHKPRLVHVPDCIRQELLEQELGPAPCIVPTLLDAARQSGWQLVASLPLTPPQQ